jgi:carboxyl-terminal processing protease
MRQIFSTSVSESRVGGARRGWKTVLGAAALLLALPACSASADRAERAAPGPSSAPIERDLALATFDSAWSRINNSYYDPDFRGIDWPGIRDELRPRAAAAGTTGGLRLVIGEMLGRLGESHFGVIPREQVDALGAGGGGGGSGDAGMELRWVEGELTVVGVRGGGGADAAGVRTGWIVDAIGEREVEGWKRTLAEAESDAVRQGLTLGTISRAGELLAGAEGSSVRVRFRDGSDRVVERDLVRGPVPGERVQFGNLPAMYAHLEHERMPAARGEGCVGVIRFNVWMVPVSAPFERAVDQLAGCRGMIVDLRGNPGGVAGMVMGTAGAFMNEAVPLGVMRTRQGELRFTVNPRRAGADGRPRQPFAGAVAVLIDELSMSTSEIFAAGMQTVGRARVFGTATPGYALPALMVRLPNGDVLYHAVANLTDPEGRRIEGSGVSPDVPVARTRGDLLAGRDRALEAAIDWIGTQPTAMGR